MLFVTHTHALTTTTFDLTFDLTLGVRATADRAGSERAAGRGGVQHLVRGRGDIDQRIVFVSGCHVPAAAAAHDSRCWKPVAACGVVRRESPLCGLLCTRLLRERYI